MKICTFLLAIAAVFSFSACVSDEGHGATAGAGHPSKPGHSHGTPSTGVDASSETGYR